MQRYSSSTWSQAQMMALAFSSGRAKTSLLAMAVAFLTITMPRMNSGIWLIVVRETWKLSTARRVCTP